MTGDLTINNELSIIVPVFNEMAMLPNLLEHLQYWQRQGCEIVMVDGGSTDGSAEIAAASEFKVIHSEQGRARQMNAGAAHAVGSALVFLHADTRLPRAAREIILRACKRPSWGRFDVVISGTPKMLRVVAYCMNLRSRLSGIATGDQAIFVARNLFQQIGGFPDQPLMEDIEFSKRLRAIKRPVCIYATVTTSGRRWIEHGVWRTIWLMWRLRWEYWRGVPAEHLAKAYQ